MTACMIEYSTEAVCTILEELEEFKKTYNCKNVESVTYTGSSITCNVINKARASIGDDISEEGLSSGKKTAIAIGSVLLSLCCLLCCCFMRRRRTYDQDDDMVKDGAESIGSDTALVDTSANISAETSQDSHIPAETPPESSPDLSIYLLYEDIDGGALHDVEILADLYEEDHRDNDDLIDDSRYGGRLLRGYDGLNEGIIDEYEHAIDFHKCKSSYCNKCAAEKEEITFISVRPEVSNNIRPSVMKKSPDETTDNISY